jgi:M6 family metalloprotease-like protein
MSATITTDATRDFKISFSAETSAFDGQFFAMALVDGQYVADVLFDDGNSLNRGGTRSFTFVKKGVPAGTHTVRMQWYAQNSRSGVAVGDRTLTVFAGPATTTGGGLAATGYEGPPVAFTSTNWTDVPNTRVYLTTSEPSTNVQIGFSAEMAVSSGRMSIRAVIDGKTSQPDNVVLVSSGSEIRAQSFLFAKKNVLPGAHTVKIQARVDAGATGQLFDRSTSVLFKRRHGVDFAQPYASLKPRQGRVPHLVICFDPKRPPELGLRPTYAQVVNQHRGNDGGWNVKAWYRENTVSRYVPDPVTFLGCNDGNWFEAPPARQGTWYWDNGAFALMWEDAIKAADPFFNFHQYDQNGDNRITGDELVVEILRPQNDPYGTHREASGMFVDGVSTPMDIEVLDVYFSAYNDRRIGNVGTVAHEAAHGMLGATDLYSSFVTRPGFHSLMDVHVNATHLDPFHKLKSGYLTPDVIEINKWATRTVRLASVETRKEAIIIYDPTKNDREYFIIENRWGGTAAAPNYDFYLSPAQPGIAVWHIVEDTALADRFRPLGDPNVVWWDWGRLCIRFLGVLPGPGASTELKWANGTSSKIRVTAQAIPAEFVDVEIAKLP